MKTDEEFYIENGKHGNVSFPGAKSDGWYYWLPDGSDFKGPYSTSEEAAKKMQDCNRDWLDYGCKKKSKVVNGRKFKPL